MKRQFQSRMRQQTLVDQGPVDLHYIEDSLYSEGISTIAGIDEAGRGPLAGPVVAAAVILPRECEISGLKDSKQLTRPQREVLFGLIHKMASAVSIGVVESSEIDRINILQASLEAMRTAVEGLSVRPDYLLIDGICCIRHSIPQKAYKKGDVRSASIAAASVIAKVTRDHMMCELEGKYPQFKFSIHKGYGTRLHLAEIRRFGPTPVHRMTFRGVKGDPCPNMT